MYANTPEPGRDEAAHQRVVARVNQLLADEFALSTATRDYHWTVTDPHFRNLSEIFDEQYHQLDQWLDKIVERAHALGLKVNGGWQELTASARLRPVGGATLNPQSMLTALAGLHEAMVEWLRQELKQWSPPAGSPALGELLNELFEYHETTAWLLSELAEDRERAQA